MFGREVRAYSHGCMRVHDPAKYAEVFLNIARPSERWTVEKVERMFGGAEQDIQLQSAQIWVLLRPKRASSVNMMRKRRPRRAAAIKPRRSLAQQIRRLQSSI
jgi:hypothetical protein